MVWQKRDTPGVDTLSSKKDFPHGLWQKCPKCSEIILISDLEENLLVCPKCGHHHRISAQKRLSLILDKDSFKEWDSDLFSLDPLKFNDGSPYQEKLERAQKKNVHLDAFLMGEGTSEGIPLGIGILDFFWMGGSMGTVVGEKIVLLFEKCRQRRLPVIIVSGSGGARMHEGILSLMQMAKTASAISLFKNERLPYLSIITDPTTGGVAASYALLGHLNIAEPGATIGFAGRRVIESTIHQKLPDDFQTSEFCLSHGMIDMIVPRSDLKRTISRCLKILSL